MTGLWRADTVAWLIALALLPVAALVILDQGIPGAARLALAAATVGAWQLVFRVARGVPFTAAGAVTVAAVGALASPDLAAWQIVLAVSFGTVTGELVFGGWGRNVLSAATLTLAFLQFSFSQAAPPEPGLPLAVASLPGAVLLLACGIAAAPILVSAALAAIAVAWLTATAGALLPALGPLVFAAVFLAADPVASAATAPGRWINGALAGGLAALFLASGMEPPRAAVFAALLAAIFAPLADAAAIAAFHRRRSPADG